MTGVYREVPLEEQDIRAVPVLRAARAFIKRGWSRRHPTADAQGEPAEWTGKPTVAWTLVGAIKEASDGIEAEYAIRLMKRRLYEWNLPDWNDHPIRTRRDVVRAIERAIGAHAPRRRPGPVCSSMAGGGWR